MDGFLVGVRGLLGMGMGGESDWREWVMSG